MVVLPVCGATVTQWLCLRSFVSPRTAHSNPAKTRTGRLILSSLLIDADLFIAGRSNSEEIFPFNFGLEEARGDSPVEKYKNSCTNAANVAESLNGWARASNVERFEAKSAGPLVFVYSSVGSVKRLTEDLFTGRLDPSHYSGDISIEIRSPFPSKWPVPIHAEARDKPDAALAEGHYWFYFEVSLPDLRVDGEPTLATAQSVHLPYTQWQIEVSQFHDDQLRDFVQAFANANRPRWRLWGRGKPIVLQVDPTPVKDRIRFRCALSAVKNLLRSGYFQVTESESVKVFLDADQNAPKSVIIN